MGVAGAALGVVCPACVVATPALLGFGLIQKVRSWFLAKRAKNRAVAPPLAEVGVVAPPAETAPSGT